MLFGVSLNYLVPAKIATFAAIWAWTVILLSQMKFRKSLSGTERDRLAFRMPFYPYSSWLALAFLALVIVLMVYFPDTQVALLVGPLWLVLLVNPGTVTSFRKQFGDCWSASQLERQ